MQKLRFVILLLMVSILMGCQGFEDRPVATILPVTEVMFTESPAISATAAASATQDEIALTGYEFPSSIDPTQRYMFYLHGKILEDQGISAVSPEYGEYHYEDILRALESYGFVVISEQRPKDADGWEYAQRTAGQVAELLEAGVPPSSITVVGASKGAAIAALTSDLVDNAGVNYVLLGTCHPTLVAEWARDGLTLSGNVLAIHDAADEAYAGSCQELFDRSDGDGLNRRDEVVLRVGTGHGILYEPLSEWVLPSVDWAKMEPAVPTETPTPIETPTLTPTPWPTSEAYFDGARVTFINNAGFLITVGDVKILIDALYNTHNPNIDPPEEVLRRAVNAQPPFDQIDLVLATHNHPDHFSADLVRDHLRNNENAVFVSSREAVRQINWAGDQFNERLVAVDLEPGDSQHLSINGIELDCLYITHGDDSILNIGMVISVGQYTFFHSGDMSVDPSFGEAVTLEELLGYGLPQKGIDLALLPSYIFSVDEFVTLVEEGIQARYVSPMHYSYQHPSEEIEQNISNAVVFKDVLENWVVP